MSELKRYEPVISASSVHDYQKWGTPTMVSGGNNTLLRQREKEKNETVRIREAAREEGYRTGYEEGIQRAKNEIEPRVQLLEKMIELLARPIETSNERIKGTVLNLLKKFAKTLFRREVSQDLTFLEETLDSAMGLLSEYSDKVVIKVSPQDYLKLEEGGLIKQLTTEQCEFFKDEQITSGGCILCSNDAIVDATVETQIDKLMSQL